MKRRLRDPPRCYRDIGDNRREDVSHPGVGGGGECAGLFRNFVPNPIPKHRPSGHAASRRHDKNRAMRRDRAKTGCGWFRTSRGTLTRNEAHPRSNYYFPFWCADRLFIPCLRLRAIKRTARFRCDRFGCGAHHRPTACDRQGASFRCLNPLKAS